MSREACGKYTLSECDSVVLDRCALVFTKWCLYIDILVKSFQSVLTDEDFDLPTPPAIAAKKGAEKVLTWNANQTETASFAHQLVFTLQSCFKDMKDKKERICLLYTSPSPRDATLSRMPSSA